MVEVPKWWTFLVRGIVAVLFGIVLLAWPGATVLVLLIVVGLFVLVEGVVAVVLSILHAKEEMPWLGLLLLGLLGIAVGVLILVRPGVSLEVLVYIIAAWAIIHGVLQIVNAVELPKEFGPRWLVGLAGALSIIIGGLLFAFTAAAVFTIILVIGIYAIVAGIIWIVVSFFVKSKLKEMAAA
ncbi:MAG: DUF308 domain-containing protein [Actinomycetota bacterium]